MSEQAFPRRAFLGGLVATGAFGWLYDSDALLARVARGTFSDIRRDVVNLAPADLSAWSDNSLDVLWVGHASVLINLFGIRILTDPVLFDWIGAQLGVATLGRRRIVGPALDPHRLPRVDLVMLSHAHMDHLDLPSLKLLPRETQIVTAPKTADIIKTLGFNRVTELAWNQKCTVQTSFGSLDVQSVEVKHWGARWKTDSYRGYVGYLLQRSGKTVLFGGDTAYTEAFSHLKGSRIDVAIMPIGSYGSRSGNHCTPEEAVRMTNDCRANYIIPIHHSTFPLGQEPWEEPLERLHDAMPGDRIALHSPGALWRLPS